MGTLYCEIIETFPFKVSLFRLQFVLAWEREGKNLVFEVIFPQEISCWFVGVSIEGSLSSRMVFGEISFDDKGAEEDFWEIFEDEILAFSLRKSSFL